jgi:hypothetical protein
MTHPSVKRLSALLLALLVVSATGCATQSQLPQVACPAIPPAPSLREPLPLVDYSISAQRDIQKWRSMLQGTPATP